MARQQGQEKDHWMLISGAFVVLIGLIYWILTTSPVMYLEYYTPWLEKQAKVYSFATDFYKEEATRLAEVIEYAEKKQSKDPAYKTINFENAKRIVNSYSVKTRLTSSIIAALILIYCGAMLIRAQMAWRKKIMNTNENIAIDTGKGVHGYISVIQKFCGNMPGVSALTEEIIKNPSPHNLRSVFSMVRQARNIPNNIAARQFPYFSPERLAILEHGKEKEYDRQQIKQNTTTANTKH